MEQKSPTKEDLKKRWDALFKDDGE